MPENDYDQTYYEGELNPAYVTASPATKKGQRKLRRARGRAKTAQAIQTHMTDSKLPTSVLSERARNGDPNAYLSLVAQGRDEDTKRVIRFGAANLGAGLAAAAGAAAVPVVEGISAGTFTLPGFVGTAGRMLGNGLGKVGEYISPVFNNPVAKFYFSRPVQAVQGAATATPKVYNWVKNGEKPSTSEAVSWGLGTGLGVALGGNWGEASKAAYEIPGYLKGMAQTGVDLGKEIGNGIVQTAKNWYTRINPTQVSGLPKVSSNYINTTGISNITGLMRLNTNVGYGSNSNSLSPVNNTPNILKTPLSIDVPVPDFVKMRSQGASKQMVENYKRIFNDIIENSPETYSNVMKYTGLSPEATIRMLSPEFYNTILKTKTPIITSPLSPESHFRTLRGLKEGQYRNFTETFQAPWDISPRQIPVSTADVILDSPPPNGITDYSGILDIRYPSAARNHLTLEEIPALVSYHGAPMPSPDHFLIPSADAKIFDTRFTKATADGFYSAFSPSAAEGYGPYQYKVVNFGNPLITNMYGKIPNNIPNSNWFDTFEVERIPKFGFDYFRTKGYDTIISPLTNEVVSGESRMIKDLESNSGMFDTSIINRSLKNGGKLHNKKQGGKLIKRK